MAEKRNDIPFYVGPRRVKRQYIFRKIAPGAANIPDAEDDAVRKKPPRIRRGGL